MTNKMGDPRFVLKHALRMRNLTLEANDDIVDLRGKKVATLGKAEWTSETELSYTIRPVQSIKFILTSIDIGSL